MTQGCNVMFSTVYNPENGPFSFLPGECQPFMNSYLVDKVYIDRNSALPGHGSIKLYSAPGCNDANLVHEGPTPIDFNSFGRKKIRSLLIDKCNT